MTQIQIQILETQVRLDAEGRYSLNDLHKASGKASKDQPSNWLRLDTTAAMIEELDRSSEVRNALNVVQGGSKQGTYVCKELVYAYAMWLSPAFHIRVVRAYDAVVSRQLLEASRIATREEARDHYPLMTKALKDLRLIAGKDTKWFHYSNEADMVNSIVLGESAKAFRVKHNLKDTDSIRDLLTFSQIAAINALEVFNTNMIDSDEEYEYRKTKLTTLFLRKHHAALPASYLTPTISQNLV